MTADNQFIYGINKVISREEYDRIKIDCANNEE